MDRDVTRIIGLLLIFCPFVAELWLLYSPKEHFFWASLAYILWTVILPIGIAMIAYDGPARRDRRQ